MISLVVLTRNRKEALQHCLKSLQVLNVPEGGMEIIVVDNASSDGTQQMLRKDYPNIIVLELPENLGVANGRNRGVALAQGEIVVLVDDDAALMQKDTLLRVEAAFTKDALLGAIAFRVMEGDSGHVEKKLIPRRDRKVFATDTEAAMFIACGVAIRRDVFQRLGGFWERLGLYFGEEPELSYRILEAGYHIINSASIEVRHYSDMSGRTPGRRIYFGTRNTPWLALKNLPLANVLSLTVLSWGYFCLQSFASGCPGSFFKGMCDCIRGLPRVWHERKPISTAALKKVRAASGVLYY